MNGSNKPSITLDAATRTALLERRAHLEYLSSGNDLTAWHEPRSGYSYANEARWDEIRWIDGLLAGVVAVERPSNDDVFLLDRVGRSQTITLNLENEA